jgi:hypothetical protein
MSAICVACATLGRNEFRPYIHDVTLAKRRSANLAGLDYERSRTTLSFDLSKY